MIIELIVMAGGLALFLYGMHILGVGLQKVSGNKLEKLLDKMTNNVIKGVLLGLVITAAVQSSSATTVIVVGLVNAGVLKLHGAAGIIMGANIGTTITGQILRLTELDSNENVSFFLELIKPTTLTPILMVIGILLFMVAKSKRKKLIGEVLLGFGILFSGMFMMTDAVKPFSDLPIFSEIFATLTNPVLGVIAGALITALVQSSSASVGILQALASTGVITYSAAFPIIMGQNIGTCITSILSSISANVNAKRAAMVHLYFNIFGTLIFLSGVYIFQYVVGFSFWDDAIDMGGIANFHTLFNVVVTLLFIPFARLLEKLAIMTIKDNKSNDRSISNADLALLDSRLTKSPSIGLSQAHHVLCKMGDFALQNYDDTMNLFTNFDDKVVEKVEDTEKIIDIMEDKLNSYLVEFTTDELQDEDSDKITHYFRIISEFERLSDYAVNILEIRERMHENKITFSEKALNELDVLSSAVKEISTMSIDVFKTNGIKLANRVEPLEQTIDELVETLKDMHIERLKNSDCSIECGLSFIEILTNLERISDHALNIAIYVLMFAKKDEEVINHHEFEQKLIDENEFEHAQLVEIYKSKYLSKI